MKGFCLNAPDYFKRLLEFGFERSLMQKKGKYLNENCISVKIFCSRNFVSFMPFCE
jgi:hypothetical protein